jgi:drug/metabolite transporter (DMT)-like permease
MSALIVITNSTFVFSITRTTIAQTLVIVASVPIATGILGHFVLNERLPLRTWLAGAACLAGVLLVVSGSLGKIGLQGDLWAIGTVGAQAAVFVGFRRHPNLSRPGLLVLAAISATLIFAPFARPFPDTRTAVAAGIDGLFIVPGGWLLTSLAPRYIPAAEVALFLLIETILGPVWVFAALGEAPTLAVVLSGMVILSAIAVHSWIDLRRGVKSRDVPELGSHLPL